MGKNKILYLAIAIIVLALIAGLIFLYMQKQNNIIQNPNLKTNTETGVLNNPTKASNSISYASALKIYSDRRLQFSIDSSNYCSVSPKSAVFRKGTNIMLDNRFGKLMTIFLDGQPYYISAYGFKIITLTTSAKLPHTIKIDCGTGKNNGTIILE